MSVFLAQIHQNSLPVSDCAAFVLNSGRKRLEWDRAPKALDVLGDDAVVERPGLDSEPGLGGRPEAEVGEADAEQGFDVFGGLEFCDGSGVVVLDVVVGVVTRDRQTVRHRELVVAAVVRVDEGEEAERRLRRRQVRRRRLAVGAEEVGDGRSNFAAAVARLHRELHDQLGPGFLVDRQPVNCCFS